jgi:hypothetical protein
MGTKALHMVTILNDENYICDCCMGLNLGLPCHHYFQVLNVMNTLKFNLGVIRQQYVIFQAYWDHHLGLLF